MRRASGGRVRGGESEFKFRLDGKGYLEVREDVSELFGFHCSRVGQTIECECSSGALLHKFLLI